LKPKPIILNFLERDERTSVYTYAFTLLSLVCLRMLPPPYSIMDVFKVDAKTYGWIFAFMSLSLSVPVS
jgi:DHA1 family bicyclomycin/chloramphenicol resistance-like MFS transporter